MNPTSAGWVAVVVSLFRGRDAARGRTQHRSGWSYLGVAVVAIVLLGLLAWVTALLVD
jgi:hypothetical protein